MHGIIHAELKKYVETKHNAEAWQAVLKEAGLGGKAYEATSTYEDAETVSIVVAASKLTGVPVPEILEDFGEFITPDLMGMYPSLIDSKWDMATFLLNVENTIHTVVRKQNPGATPPQLKFKEVAPNVVELHYDSPRQMHAVAKGILKGVAKHYGKKVQFSEQTNADKSVDLRIEIS